MKQGKDWELFWHTILYGTVIVGVFVAVVETF